MQIWQSKEMSNEFLRGQSMAKTCFSNWDYKNFTWAAEGIIWSVEQKHTSITDSIVVVDIVTVGEADDAALDTQVISVLSGVTGLNPRIIAVIAVVGNWKYYIN